MEYELTFWRGGQKETAFLQNGFFDPQRATSSLHQHKYTEFHILQSGKATFYIGNTLHSFEAGDAFALPPGIFHCCTEAEAGTQSIAFQTTAAVAHFCASHVPQTILDELAQCINNLAEPSGCAKLAALLSYLCADFLPESTAHFQKISDPSMRIQEYISNHYSEACSLAELAALLHFSEKHTERLVKECTGQSFKRALVEYRMTVADYLKRNTQKSDAEIADYVGYATYNGFWKARTKWEKQKELEDES